MVSASAHLCQWRILSPFLLATPASPQLVCPLQLLFGGCEWKGANAVEFSAALLAGLWSRQELLVWLQPAGFRSPGPVAVWPRVVRGGFRTSSRAAIQGGLTFVSMATTMTLSMAPPILKSGSVLINPPSTTSRADAHSSCIRSFVCSCGPAASSSYSSHQTSFRGALLTGMPASYMSRTRRARTRSVRAVQNSSSATSSTDTTEERIRVKQELLNLLEQTEGSIPPEGLEIIGALQKLNPNPVPSRVPELVNGCFEIVGGTLKGKATENAGVFSSTFTLGRVTFNAFKPQNQEVIMKENYHHAGYDHEDEYLLAFVLSIKNREGESPEALEGYLLNRAKYSFAPDSDKLLVTFLSSELRPAAGVTEEDLRSWKQLFQEENPDMDERGWMSVKLPEAVGNVDHLYLDDDLRIQQGNLKNIYVIRRLPEPAIPFYQ